MPTTALNNINLLIPQGEFVAIISPSGCGKSTKKRLDGFAYVTDISVMSFLLAGILALAIAVVTISYQAIRSAIANPVHALKYE